MEFIIDRILTILEAKLPMVLAQQNTFFSASDITNYGVALELFAPRAYKFGTTYNIGDDAPVLQIYRTGGMDKEEYGMSEPGVKTLTYNVDFFFQGDRREVVDRLAARYTTALCRVLGKYNKLSNPAISGGEIAKWGSVTKISPLLVFDGGVNFNVIEISLKYDIMNKVVWESNGIYE